MKGRTSVNSLGVHQAGLHLARNMYGWLDDVRFFYLGAQIKEEMLVAAFGLDAKTWSWSLVEKECWITDSTKSMGWTVKVAWPVPESPPGGKSWIEVTLDGPAYLEFHHKSLGRVCPRSSPLQCSLDDTFASIWTWLGYSRPMNIDWIRGVIGDSRRVNTRSRWVVENNFGNEHR